MTRARFLELPDSAPLANRDEYDVCVVGAGAAGLYLTSRLAAEGLRVALIDRGPMKPKRVMDGSDFACLEDRYSGATEGRDFGFGGSTSRWGGLLVPHLPSDVRSDAAWKAIFTRVQSAAGTVLGHLGWPTTRSFAATWFDGHRRSRVEFPDDGISCVSSLYLPFRRKNLRWLLTGPGAQRYGVVPDVYLQRVATDWRLSDSDPPHAREVTAAHTSGHRLVIRSRRFVIAAGALESTRSALEIARVLPQGALGGAKSLGLYLSDHLSFCAGTFEGRSKVSAIEQLGLWFENGWMRGHRFAGDASFGARSFAHVAFDSEDPAFVVAREVMRAIQGRRMPLLKLGHLAEASVSIPAMIIDRYARKRLRLSARTGVRLQVDIEQRPDPRNSLLLRPDKADAYGRPSLGIQWAIRDADRAELVRAQSAYLERLNSLPGFPEVTTRDLVVSGAKAYDAYHPVGTCRLGLDDDSVVDPSLKVRGLDNVWIASTAVLPSAGSANPTFSMLCLAEHAATAIAEAQ